MAEVNLDEEEELARKQTHKAAIHYTVGRLCEEVRTRPGFDLTFSTQVIATLAEVTHRQMTLYAGDLEAYAGHAKRTAINADDVKLLVRRNKYLAGHISEVFQKMEEEGTVKKKRGRKRKKEEEEEEGGGRGKGKGGGEEEKGGVEED